MKRLALTVVVGLTTLLLARAGISQEWNLQPVDNSGDWGYSSRIVTTSDGTPCILYNSSSYAVKLAWWVSETDSTGGWRYFALGSTYGYLCSMGLVVDSDDNLHVAWRGFSPLTSYGVFSLATENWVIGPEAALSGYCACDLALFESGTTDTPGIVALAGGLLSFVVRNPATGQWSSPETIQAAGVSGNPSIAVDSSGQFHVAYYESSGDGNLKYAMRTGNIWGTCYVEMGNVGSYCSLVVDPSYVHIVYYAAGPADLKYARLINP